MTCGGAVAQEKLAVAGNCIPADAPREPGKGGGTRGLLSSSCICCSFSRPARMRGPNQSLRKAMASPAAASHA